MIFQILLAGGAVALIAMIRKVIKEGKELVKVYEDAKVDGEIDDKEMAAIGKEAIEFIISIINLVKLIKKTFKGKLKK